MASKLTRRIFNSIVIIASVVFSLASSVATANDKHFDFRINPITWALGAYDLEFNYRVTSHVMLGPIVSYWRGPFNDHDIEIQRYGARVNLYLREPFRDGPYLSPFYHVVTLGVKQNDQTYGKISGKGDVTYFGVYLGYRWHWDFANINLGIGYADANLESISLNDSSGIKRESIENSDANNVRGIALDFTVGRSF